MSAAHGAARAGGAPPSVLILVGGLGYGGAERQARFLASALPAQHFRVQVACFSAAPEHRARVEDAGAGVHILPPGGTRTWPIRVYPHIVRLLREHRTDLVQAFLPSFDILAPCLRVAKPRLRVVTSRRTMDDRIRPRQLRLMRATSRFAHAVVANSDAVADSVLRLESIPASRIHVIRNGIALAPVPGPEAREPARARLGIVPGDIAVLYLAHFRNGKGHRHLPAVIAGAVARHPEARFLVVGDTEGNSQYRENSASFRQAIEAAGLQDRVIVTGLLRNVADCYAAADIVLNLSDFEGMSNVLMEAMGGALAIVATDAGGARETLVDGVQGFIVPRGDSAAAIDRLDRLMSDTELRHQMGRAGRTYMEQEFSVSRMARAYAELYRRLLGTPDAPRA